jgi:hypothetical protein
MCYKHSANVRLTAHLQDALKIAYKEEEKEKKLIELEQTSKINQRLKTGIKPEGWERADDYAWNKRLKEEEERDERINKHKEEMQKESEKKKNEQKDYEELFSRVNNVLEEENKKAEKMQKLRISGGNDIISFIDEYLKTLPDKNRKIETCNNIIKYCRNISVELQKNT